MEEKEDNRLINLAELRRLVPVSADTIRRMEDEGAFPRRLKIGSRVLWNLREVQGWIDEQTGSEG